MLYPQKKSFLASKPHSERRETRWNNVAYEAKRKKNEKSYRFAHPALGSTYPYLHLNQREGMATWEKKEPLAGSKNKIRNNRKELK